MPVVSLALAVIVAAGQDQLARVLVFSRTAGFRHKSIPAGIQAVREIGEGLFVADATEDSAAFTPDNLKRYRAVVFLSTTGDILDPEQERAFEEFIRAGGGYAGIHAAADTEYEWPWYGSLVGAYFKGHPPVQQATIKVEDRTHRSTRHLPADWVRTDEWYAFKTNPRADTRVLASLDETTYKPAESAMGDHPIAWYHEFDGGRSWYTALGHTEESFSEPLFRTHLREGIAWAAGLKDAGVKDASVKDAAEPAAREGGPASEPATTPPATTPPVTKTPPATKTTTTTPPAAKTTPTPPPTALPTP